MLSAALTYQHNGPRLVRIPPIPFQTRLADAIRMTRRSARVSEPDSQMLSDMATKGAGLVRFERLANISATCTDLGDAVAIAEAFRGHALAFRQIAPLDVLEAMRVEQKTDGAEDIAVQEYLMVPCEANRQRAIEALRRAAEAALAVVDALHQRGPQ